VKQTFKKAEQDNEKQPVRYNSNNNYHRQLIILTKKPVTATEEEILVNPRSRSAKLRAGEKVQRENREIKNSRKPSRQNTQEEK